MGSLISGAFSAHAAGDEAKQQAMWTQAQNTIDTANTGAENTVNAQTVASNNAIRLAQNAVSAANASASNMQRSIGNQVKLTKLGQQSNTMEENIARTADATVRGSISARLTAATQLGALSAQAAAAGTGGGSVEALKSALNIQQTNADEQRTTQATQQSYDAIMQRNGMQSQRYLALDLGQSVANINYAQDVYTPQTVPLIAGNFAADWEQQGMEAYFGATDYTKVGSQAQTILNSGYKSPGAYSTGNLTTTNAGSYDYYGSQGGNGMGSPTNFGYGSTGSDTTTNFSQLDSQFSMPSDFSSATNGGYGGSSSLFGLGGDDTTQSWGASDSGSGASFF